MYFSVIVPTYKRGDDLQRCLRALGAQRRPADEIVVVYQISDVETRQVLSQRPDSERLTVVTVSEPGVVAALNAGLDRARGDVVAMTDDDAAPQPDWLLRMETHYRADERVGGVGGRDWIWENGTLLGGRDGTAPVVGRLAWWGVPRGYHHLGTGPPRAVDSLKGVNMSFRREAIRGLCFDRSLRGTGAQSHNELVFCLAVRRRGWTLLYDPTIIVDHYPGVRHGDPNQRVGFNPAAIEEYAHNLTYALASHLDRKRLTLYLLHSLILGSRRLPGLLLALETALHSPTIAWPHFAATWRGRLGGLATARGHRRDANPSAADLERRKRADNEAPTT